jgi:hypothetical protein
MTNDEDVQDQSLQRGQGRFVEKVSRKKALLKTVAISAVTFSE